MGTEDQAEPERRTNWYQTMADVAVTKEIQIQQTVLLGKLAARLDQLWDQYQRDQGALATQLKLSKHWRWFLSFAVAVLGVILAYRIGTHP